MYVNTFYIFFTVPSAALLNVPKKCTWIGERVDVRVKSGDFNGGASLWNAALIFFFFVVIINIIVVGTLI